MTRLKNKLIDGFCKNNKHNNHTLLVKKAPIQLENTKTNHFRPLNKKIGKIKKNAKSLSP